MVVVDQCGGRESAEGGRPIYWTVQQNGWVGGLDGLFTLRREEGRKQPQVMHVISTLGRQLQLLGFKVGHRLRELEPRPAYYSPWSSQGGPRGAQILTIPRWGVIFYKYNKVAKFAQCLLSAVRGYGWCDNILTGRQGKLFPSKGKWLYTRTFIPSLHYHFPFFL